MTTMDNLHAEALDEFAQACMDDPSYRLTRSGPNSVDTLPEDTLGILLTAAVETSRGWVKAVIRDELHGRALADSENYPIWQESGGLTPEEAYAVECGNPWS